MKIFILLFLVVFCGHSMAANQQAILRVEGEKVQNIKEGDSFIATLVLWPINHIEEGSFKKTYENKTFLDYFFASEVIEEGQSINNVDAYNVKLRLVLKKFFDNRNFVILSFRGLNIPVEIKGINPIPLKGRNQKFVFLGQDYKEKHSFNWWPYIIMALLVLPVILHLIRKKWMEKKKVEEYLKEKRKWLNKFNEVEKREDFEFIYSSRDKWIEIVGVKTPEMIEFFNTLNRYQYKKVWNDDEFNEISTSFEPLRKLLL